jgi:predicted CXXCH cytochrome family protein
MKTSQSIFFAVVALISTSSLCYTQDKPALSCITTACHASMGKGAFVHGPVAAEECSPCHVPRPNERHKFTVPARTEDLCVSCHEAMKKQGVVHGPVNEGKCTACHDPHQSAQRYFLRGETVAALCVRCHDKSIISNTSTHFPVAEGECLSCHRPHMSAKPKLLSQEGNAVCFECHKDMQESMAASANVHKPAKEKCLTCHNAHSGKGPSLLASEPKLLCLTCHPAIADHIAKATVPHRALDADKGCVNCHKPHESKATALLKNDPMELCLSCHDRTLGKDRGDSIGDMKKLFAENPDWHGPIRDHDCSGCHDVHGSESFRILRMNYPREFYSSFSETQYELCFSCHPPTLVQDQLTTTLTGFRDGQRNMHFLHVNRAVKGRTCRSCHETHASQKEKHIRERVPFGQWSLPIRYEKKEDGGKCSPGCHAPKTYSRSAGADAKVKK